MPFDYEDYQKKCNALTTEQLHKEWENYTRQISGGATSTATSVLFSPLTGGISLVGLGLSAPRIHNARKKREIIEAGLQARGTTHNTRKRDVIAPMAVAGTLGGLTLGLAGPGADMIAGAAVGHGMEYAVSHAALDATGAVIEHSHDDHSKKKADEKLQKQYQNFQQQHVQAQAQLSSQPGLQIIPPAPQHSRPGTPQQGQVPPNQLSSPQPALQIPPPVPQHSRPGTPQQSQVPQYQPQVPSQDQKYEYVPVPAAHNHSVSYQPASHQQQFAQSVSVTQPQVTSTLPQNQPIQQPEKYLVTVPSHGGILKPESYFPEKNPAYASTAPQNELSGLSSCPSPPPQYSSPHSVSTPQNNIFELSADTTTSSGAHSNHPQMHIDLPPAPPTMEEEILFLKARLIQLELEKRQAMPTQEIPPATNVGDMESHPSLTLTPPSTVQAQEPWYYPPPPASPALPPRSPSVASQQLPPNQPQQYFPPPPPSPRPQVQMYAPPPESLYTYNPQSYPQPPPSPNSQQQQLPQFQRHDSGYHSNAPTPSPSNRLSQSFLPGQTGYPISPQSTGQHSHNPSLSSLGQPSPMSPAPPPYFPPPPGSSAGVGKDYFAQGVVPASPNTGGNQNYQGQSLHGTQGWQWGMSAPVSVSGQPNYGPPPPIPTPWKG